MANIIENPTTKEIFLQGFGQQFYSFDGTPYSADTIGWKVVGQAPDVKSWIAEPGNYGTFYGSMTVAMLDGKKWLQFTMGDNISFLRNWLLDAQSHNTVSIVNQRAYSDRNVARSKATYQ